MAGPMPTLNELLHAASRTFALGIDLLPEPLREQVQVAYLLLRISDYLEDNVAMTPERKAELLKLWAEVLEEHSPVEHLARELKDVNEDTPDALVARSVLQVHGALVALPSKRRALVVHHVRDSTLGMASWALRGPDIRDEADLDDYMHEVAGRVGWLLTELFAEEVPQVRKRKRQMMMLGREFGLALQTVNVIRGLHSDWERGWIYVPATFTGELGEPARIFAQGNRDPLLEGEVLDRLVSKAERHLEAARFYISRIPSARLGIRLFCLLPWFFAVRTLAISRGNPKVFEEEVKIGREEVRRIVWATRVGGWSDLWVRWYAGRLGAKASDASEVSR